MLQKTQEPTKRTAIDSDLARKSNSIEALALPLTVQRLTNQQTILLVKSVQDLVEDRMTSNRGSLVNGIICLENCRGCLTLSGLLDTPPGTVKTSSGV